MEKIFRSEKLKQGVDSFRFINLRPAGNDTGLVRGIVRDQTLRKQIQDKIIGVYPNIEQVGFVNLDPKNPELMMTGGEFCGNATRSAAYLALYGRPGEVKIKVSGVKGKLKAGVEKNGDAYAQMPIYEDPKKIKRDPLNPKGYIVELQGITQYVNFDTSEIKGLSPEAIKAKGKETIDRLGLTKYPAAGVIYSEQTEEGISIKPVVWVKNADTLYLETACASGTAALGQVLALQNGASIKDVSIKQPSGKSMKVSVEYNKNLFGYAQISGPVEVLNYGSFSGEKNQEYVIEKISQASQLERFIDNGSLFQLYQDIFSQPPYQEQFTLEEVKSIFAEYAEKGILFLAEDRQKGKLIGFGAALPLKYTGDVREVLKDAIDVENAWYMADLGVDKDYRRLGIAKTLVQERLRLLPKNATAVMRTSEKNKYSRSLYESLGFNLVESYQIADGGIGFKLKWPIVQWVEQKRIDGKTIKDPRIFMSKRI